MKYRRSLKGRIVPKDWGEKRAHSRLLPFDQRFPEAQPGKIVTLKPCPQDGKVQREEETQGQEPGGKRWEWRDA
jgi:hypothetical protein